jgi:uncharacterized protein YybS (DUF2232 family)
LFGWLNGLLAVPIFLLLQSAADEKTAGRQIRNGLLLAGFCSLLLGRFSMFLFTLTMLPVGYSLHLSAVQRKSPAESGATALMTLGLSWLLFWSLYGMLNGTNPYLDLLTGMDALLEQLTAAYRANPDLSVDVLYDIEQIIAATREILPKILPGLLAGMVLVTVSLNMLISGALVRRLVPEQAPWPPYSEWHLPDKTVWLLIFAFILLLVGTGGVKNTGMSLLIVAGMMYFFQGAAVVVHVLNRWKLPRAFRFFVYVLIFFQRYGMLLVAIVGTADTWADFRKLDREENNND